MVSRDTMLTIDFETKSYADLQKVGAWAYSEDKTTDVICACWAVDAEEPHEWYIDEDGDICCTDELLECGTPKSIYMAIMTGHYVEAHNVSFEISIWTNVLNPQYGWMIPYEHSWRDTMAVACYYALPAKLERLARALGYPGKDPEGGRLITKYSKLYLKTAKDEIPPEDLRKFIDYCHWDVKLEQAVSDELGDLPDREAEIFQMDLETNMRGLCLDEEGIQIATSIVDQRVETLTSEFNKLTGLNPTQRDKVIAWFKDQDVELENMKADYLEELLEDGELPSGSPRRALEIRLAINKASTKKLDAMARNAGLDGRARFQTRYHGAATGRNTGSGFQPLNLVRGFEDVQPEQLVRDIRYGSSEWLDSLYGDAMEAVSKASRHWIVAGDGNKIIAGDFVSIEAVVIACLAGEDWKIEAFRNGDPIYELMACDIHALPKSAVKLAHKDKEEFKKKYPKQRFDGKTGELAFQYQGALGAWRKFDKSETHEDEAVIGFCKTWRARNTQIVNFWYGLQREALDAVEHPGKITGYREIGFEIVDEWLSMILPNGKRIWYRDPQIRMGMPNWHQPEIKEECREGSCNCEPIPKLSYMANKEGQWKRVYTYGGKLAENATQATSREVLAPARRRAKEAGYHEILTVYDEIVCEEPIYFGSVDHFTELMLGPPEDWYADWPIHVDAWEGERYKK